MSGKEDLESPSNSSSLKKIDISKGPFNITVSNAATIVNLLLKRYKY